MELVNPNTALRNLILLGILVELITRVVNRVSGVSINDNYQGQQLTGNYVAELITQRVNIQLSKRN
jgi:hypothetical protein